MVVGQFEIPQALAKFPGLWETVGMSKKRTKADKSHRQADQLEKKVARRPAQAPKKRPPREDFSQAA